MRRRVFLAVALVACLWGNLKEAEAQGRRWTFPLVPLGVSEPIVLSGPSAEYAFSIPIPRGLRPLRLWARVRISPEAMGATLGLHQEDRTLWWGRLEIPEMRMAIPLEGIRVDRARVTLSWSFQAPSPVADCAAPERIRAELDRLEVELEGEPEPPSIVAAFWPPVLRALHIQVPDPLGPEEATAVLRLAALGARLAGGQPLTLTVSPPGPILPSDDPWTRWVRIERGPSPRMALVPVEGSRTPILEIAGPVGSLEAAVTALSTYGEAMLAPVVSSPTGTLTASSPSMVTLAALGFPQIQMSGSGMMEARIFFSQADLGGPVRSVRLRLAGRMTPIPSGGQAQLWVLLNGGLAYAEPLAGGPFDRWIDLPDGLLRRDNLLVLRVAYTPPGGECRLGVHPIAVFIDGASYFQFQRGTHLPPGFERLPQGLLPRFIVGLDPLSPETLEAAADLVAALQRTTRTPLVPQVRPWAEALSAPDPVLLVTLDPDRAASLHPPLDPRPFRVVDIDGREVFRMEIDRDFAALEAFTAGGREVLLLTRHGGHPDLRGIAEMLDPRLGWYGLSGDVWIWAEGEPPISLRLRGSGLQVEPLPPSPAGWARFRIWILVAAFIGVIAFLIWVYPRVVRPAPPRAVDSVRGPGEPSV